jgi:hypothetical protein
MKHTIWSSMFIKVERLVLQKVLKVSGFGLEVQLANSVNLVSPKKPKHSKHGP